MLKRLALEASESVDILYLSSKPSISMTLAALGGGGADACPYLERFPDPNLQLAILSLHLGWHLFV